MGEGREVERLDSEGGKKGDGGRKRGREGGQDEWVEGRGWNINTHTHTHTHRELEEDEGTNWMFDERFGSRRSSCAGRMTRL